MPLYKGSGLLDPIRIAVEELRPDVAIDLSDEPIVGYEERMEIASLLSALGVDYMGSDFTFKAPMFPGAEGVKSIGLIGTGKRVGKTAVSAHVARFYKKNKIKPVVLAMGRGGPVEPVVIDGNTVLIDNEFLMELKRSGKHAASDYVEDAMMSRVMTVGCRRCGGGMAGMPFVTNVSRGVEVAKGLSPDIIILEGSGSAIPPFRADKYVTVSSLQESESHVLGFLGPFRIYISSLLILTNCETPEEKKRFERVMKKSKKMNPNIKVVGTVFRPKPLEPVTKEKVFLATTANELSADRIAKYLSETQNCEVVHVSSSLAERNRLKQELEAKKHEFTHVVTELKAAAVDVILDFANKNDKKTVFFDNVPHAVIGNVDLEKEYMALAREVGAVG